jgi:beta-phosphoglucomutase-like phosphatase (HAD superfamily)
MDSCEGVVVNTADALVKKLGLSCEKGFIPMAKTTGGLFEAGRNGVCSVWAPADGKVEFILFDTGEILARVNSATGWPAYYPVPPVEIRKPVKAVLMDLDGTSVRSEHFWIWIIERTTASLLGDPVFKLEDEDFSHVSGHSVSEHLQYCIDKYCPGRSLVEARGFYFEHTHREMKEIMEGRGKTDAFTPTSGLKEFLLELQRHGIKLGLVTSGLYEKAMPEIISAFRQLDMGNPVDFYDAIITAGFPMRRGKDVGTLGELEPKPHPWLYAEVAKVGLGLSYEDRHHVVGIEDSGAGVCSIRLAGFACIGIGGGNIDESGTRGLCTHYEDNFEAILKRII